MERKRQLERLASAFGVHPIVALLGARQCGKTTLAQEYIKNLRDTEIHYFDLEDTTDLAKLQNPQLVLSELSGLIVIDEIQRLPELFPTLRVLIDRFRKRQRYLILGSASRDLVQQASETLAGRIVYVELEPFSYFETHELRKLWVRGGFPLAYLAKNADLSFKWRKAYIRTFLERDIPALGIRIPANTMRRFWLMLTHYHGNVFNASELGRSFGVADTTVRGYLDILTETFMVRQLTPWLENIKKRQLKAPKIYFRDSGLLHTLLDISNHTELIKHPKLGASWEGFALEEIIRGLEVEPEHCFFWGIHNQAELDLLIFKDGKRLGFEFKYSAAPTLSKSMQKAIEFLGLDCLTVIFPGQADFPLAKNVRAVGLEPYLRSKLHTRA
jgi:uncharacterized protein